jgi:hypothetical protein
MTREKENTAFVCANCGSSVTPVTNGSYRNHCPFCLYSVHLDNVPGDRLSTCKGLMKPVALDYKAKKGWQIAHVCLKCGIKKLCKVAIDTVDPDDYKVISKMYT